MIDFGSELYSNLIWLANILQRNPGGPHHGVPDEAFVPHFNNEAKIQTVDFTRGKKQIKCQVSSFR